MTDATSSYGWSGLTADGRRIFVQGPVPAATALSGVTAYATKTDYATAKSAGVPLGILQASQIEAIDRACAASIVGGFSSSALGAVNRYGSKTVDQANLDGDMMAAAQATGPTSGANATATISCSADDGTTWAPQVHNQVQIGQLWADFRSFRTACQARKRTLQAQVAAATTAAAVEAVVWN